MKDKKVMVVHIKDDKEKAHHCVEIDRLENHKKFYEEFGYVCEVYTMSAYKEKFGEDGLDISNL